MVNQQIVKWIKENVAKGSDLGSLKANLLIQGYSENEINEAINSVKTGEARKKKMPFWIIGGIAALLIIFGLAWFFWPSGHQLPASPIITPHVTPSTNITSPVTPPANITVVKACMENWTCSNWSNCSNGGQTRQCTCACANVSKCTGDNSMQRSCSAVACIENWTCSGWGNCSNWTQARTCNDANKCGTQVYEPKIIQRCPYVMGVVMIGFYNTTSINEKKALIDSYGLNYSDHGSYWLVSVPSGEEQKWIGILGNESIVEYADLNRIAH